MMAFALWLFAFLVCQEAEGTRKIETRHVVAQVGAHRGEGQAQHKERSRPGMVTVLEAEKSQHDVRDLQDRAAESEDPDDCPSGIWDVDDDGKYECCVSNCED